MNMMKSMIWAQVAALASLSLFADTQKVGNYTWTYRIEGGKAEIYSGSSYTAAISPWPEGHVDIPSTLGGKPVTKIGNSAFYYCEKLAYVSIPDSVTSIGACAFDGCALEELTIPDGVTEIGTSAFDGCHSLRSVTLGSDVTSLARRSFAYCTNLTSIVFRGDAPGITADTFDHVHPGCAVFVQRGTSGWGVGIPGKWNGFDIYYNGINEEWVDGYRWTFRIRNGGTAEVCGDSSAIAVSPGPTGALTIPATLGGRPVTYVTGDAFPGCTGLTDVALPYSVIGMGNYAFQGCAGLTTARVPILFLTRNLNTAFYDCPSVHFRFCGTQAVDSVVWHYQLFESADPGGRSAELRNIDVNSAALMPTTRSGPLLIPSEIVGCTVRCIGRNALIRCKNLRSMSIPSTVTNIDSYAFAYCESLRAAVVPGDVKGLGDFAYAGCTNLASVTISTNVTVIRDYTFFNCTSLAKINLPDSVRKIDSNAFYGCSGLASVTIPNSVTNIGSAAFRFCGTLTDVRIPDSVEKIGYYAFADCASLTNVSIPKALNGKIHASVFAGCPDNLTVTYRGPESDVTFIVSGGVFSGSNFGDMDGKSGTVVMTLEYGRGKYNSGMRAERDGAAFAGWWTARDGGTPQYDANGACIPGEGCWNSARQWSHLGNAKLYARLGEPHHPTFYSNGGYFSGANFGNMDGKSGILQLYVTCGKGT